jgi:hypothetical protein
VQNVIPAAIEIVLPERYGEACGGLVKIYQTKADTESTDARVMTSDREEEQIKGSELD